MDPPPSSALSLFILVILTVRVKGCDSCKHFGEKAGKSSSLRI